MTVLTPRSTLPPATRSQPPRARVRASAKGSSQATPAAPKIWSTVLASRSRPTGDEDIPPEVPPAALDAGPGTCASAGDAGMRPADEGAAAATGGRADGGLVRAATT